MQTNFILYLILLFNKTLQKQKQIWKHIFISKDFIENQLHWLIYLVFFVFFKCGFSNISPVKNIFIDLVYYFDDFI